MNNNNISIEKMKISDIEIIKNIEKELNINILPYNSIVEDLKNSNYLYFICKLSNIIVGYIALSLVIDTMDILSIVVKKDYQRCGIATNMLDYIIGIAKEKNIANIFLEVRKSNAPAISLYKKFGFIEISIRKNYYKNPQEDAIIFKKQI